MAISLSAPENSGAVKVKRERITRPWSVQRICEVQKHLTSRERDLRYRWFEECGIQLMIKQA